jgi:hypothetical protein
MGILRTTAVRLTLLKPEAVPPMPAFWPELPPARQPAPPAPADEPCDACHFAPRWWPAVETDEQSLLTCSAELEAFRPRWWPAPETDEQQD